jgi:thioredoxin-like negative regulator of GroEL
VPAPEPGEFEINEGSGVDVDVDLDVERAIDSLSAPPRESKAPANVTMPGLGQSPTAPRRDLTPTSSWVAPSVVATWPAQEALGASESSAHIPIAVDGGALTPDLPLGEKAGQADDPAALLEMLRARGIFEPPQASSPVWTGQHELPRTGTRLRNTLITAWATTLVLSGAGYFGWQQWVAHRHADAAQLVAEAKADAFEGDYAKLIDAERLLRLARDKHPRSLEVPKLELFVHAERVLESGSNDLSSLRASLLRAEHVHVDQAYLAAARAVVALHMGTPSEAEAALKAALDVAKGEPELLYIAGRLQQRLGQNDASARLQAAVAAAPALTAAALALAEGEQVQGHESEALAGFEAVLKRQPQQLRAQLWRAFLTADAKDPAQAMSALDAVSKDAHAGAPVDRILWALARARVLQRKGDLAKAGEAARDALTAGASDPRLLALAAGEARRTGQLGVAQQAASQAVSAAPGVIAYRVLLASILVERHDGEAAWNMLAVLPADEPALLVMRARAALQTGEPQALRAALAQLEAQAPNVKPGIERASLRIRLHAVIDPNPKLLQDAKALLRKTPGDPDALRALGESGLALRDAREAVTAFQQLVAMTPDDAEAHHLLARARRLAVDPKGAEASLRKALELSPGFVAAMVTLGGLLLDTGKYEEADAVYQALATHSVRDGRLGRAEALLGLGRVDDAQAQISGLPENQRDAAASRETAAKVALARHKPGEALTLLRPLLEGEVRRASALALYGDALYAAAQVNAAAGAFDSALAIDAEFPEALLGRGEVDIRAERFQEAVDVLEKAKTSLAARLRAPELRARMLTLLGHAYVLRAKKHDLETARDLLREAVKLPNPPAESFFWLGEALGGRITPESAAAFKRYMELEPQGDYVARAKRALGPLL